MKKPSQIAPGVYYNSPRWLSNPLAIPLNESIPVDSVAHLIPTGPNPRRFDYGPVPAPDVFQGPSRELRNLRRDKVWKKGGKRDEQVAQMHEWFPDVYTRDATPKLDNDVAMSDLSLNSPAAPSKNTTDTTGFPASDIGIFGKLPGEIRNRIYRYAVLEPDAKNVSVEMVPLTCSQGTCLHSKASSTLPGIASTCKQLRWEVAPIFLAENTGFSFDDGVVQQCCVSNYLRSLGSYADLIPQFSFQLKRPIWNLDQFTEFATYTFVLTTPKSKGSEGEFSLEQFEVKDRDICQCVLDELVAEMNKQKDEVPPGKLVLDFVDSEEFADFVWRVRKTKQWTMHLQKCKKCKEVIFNN